jgi:hypothetical protein
MLTPTPTLDNPKRQPDWLNSLRLTGATQLVQPICHTFGRPEPLGPIMIICLRQQTPPEG